MPPESGNIRKRLALLSVAAVAVACEIGCGKYRRHVYESRLVGHYAAYFQDKRRPPTGDTLELNENGSCVHAYFKSGEKEPTEQSCTWKVTDKVDGSWLLFDGLSDGVHRHCKAACVVEAAAWDDDFVTRFDLPSSPDIVYVK